MRSYQALLAGSVLALGLASSAHAAFPVYPTPGVENPITYSFSAASTGSIVAFFAGADAGDDEDLGLIINGVDQGAGVFPNHSTAVGDTFSWAVTAGDSLVFDSRRPHRYLNRSGETARGIWMTTSASHLS